MKNLLWVSPYVPYDKIGHAGGQTLNYYIKNLKKHVDADIKIVSVCKKSELDKMDCDAYGIKPVLAVKQHNLKDFIGKVFSINSKVNPLHKNCGMISSYTEHLIKNKLKELKSSGYRPDVIILEWTQYVLLIDSINKIFPRSRIVADEMDVAFIGLERKVRFYRGVKKLFLKIKYKNLLKREISAVMQCDLILVQNKDNGELLVRKGVPREKIQWLVPYYHNMGGCMRKSNGRDILFFGDMSRLENYLSAIWFIEKVMPLLTDIDVRFVILGNNPPAQLSKYESDKVHITGYVDSIVPFFENSMCFVAPLVLGAGIKVKVIEAMSSGLPVLTNDIGIEGIPAENGKDYIHCTRPEDYEKAIRMIFANPDTGYTLGTTSAKKIIAGHFSIEKSLEEYKNSILSLSNRE